MRFLIWGCLLCLTINVTAQQLSPQAINPAGQGSSNGNILLESSVGGVAVASFAGITYLYTQDFLQPFAGITTTIPSMPSLTVTMGIGIDNAGSTLINSDVNAMLEFTVGEASSISLQQGSEFLTQGILQPYQGGTTLPVTNLQFAARRINQQQVQLSWQTEQEFNNRGFYIERKKENETQFSVIGFVPSKASNGYSLFRLNYEQADANAFSGKTYYRLQQEDIDGRSVYSAVRMVSGSDEKKPVLKAWPIPAHNDFYVQVQGIEKLDLLQIFDVNGRMVKSAVISNQQQLHVYGIVPGTYILQLAGKKELVQKIIVQ